MMPLSKRTKIVCTIGPASRDVAVMARMAEAGMDIARLNFSHGTHEDHTQLFKRLRLAGSRVGRAISVLQDLQGPKIRVGNLPSEGVILKNGQQAVFTTAHTSRAGDIPVTLERLHQDVKPGDHILLDDGLMDVEVERVLGKRILTRIVHGGILLSHKGMNLPGTSLKIPALSAKDRSDALFGVELGVDMIALSFVRRAQDVKDLRRLLSRTADGKRIRIIAKIEKREAVEALDEILDVVDGIMVARGDLGVEVAAATVPVIQKQIVAACRERSLPVIVATQMLDSMIRNPRPTRAEVSDVANAVADHADAVMLSGETAFGSYPVEAVGMMTETIQAIESSHFDNVDQVDVTAPHDLPEAIGATVRVLADALGHAPVIVATATGYTAHRVSAFRPEAPVYALTFDRAVERWLKLVWGVQSFSFERKRTPEAMVQSGIQMLKKTRRLVKGQRVIVVTGSPNAEPKSANRIEIMTV